MSAGIIKTTKRDNVKKKRANVVVNKFPQNDCTEFNQPKVLPGNPLYSNMSGQGRKVFLLSDSILSRIQMREFNNELKVGRAYRKYFPGATPTEIAHYCLPTLIKDKPDEVGIHVGTGSLFNDEYCEIANQIFNLVKIWRDHGINEIFVSGITLRKNHMMKVRQLNNLIDMKKLIYDFKFINNDNRFEKDIGKDNIHLNNLSDISENNLSDTSEYDVVVQHEDDPFTIRIKNINRRIIDHLNINRIEGKFAALKEIIQCNIDILVISETKLDESYYAVV